jgi:hypothetical protein
MVSFIQLMKVYVGCSFTIYLFLPLGYFCNGAVPDQARGSALIR